MLTRPGTLQKTLNFEKTFILVVFVLAFLVRILGLGYSHYYGDEIKTLYMDKTVPASEFFLNQRKGPVQFFASWVMEKISGGYSEAVIRLPFSLASSLSVLVFYLVVKKLFGKNPAYFATAIYAFSGFSVAFGRTAQYQSFLMLFGFLALYFSLLYRDKKNKFLFVISAFFWILSVYSHYDGAFFLVPILFLSLDNKKDMGVFLKFFAIPSILFLLPFYLPYILKGYLLSNTINYVSRRVSGSGYLPNNSLFTIVVYNPFYVFFMFMFAGLTSFLFKKDRNTVVVQLWFLVTFVFYEIYIKNPGTHVQNYLIPLIVLAGVAFSKSGIFVRYVAGILVVLTIFISFYTFVPFLNKGYPFKDTELMSIPVKRINKKYQLFLYGFPYNRGWDQVAAYFKGKEGVRGVYTNDNDSFKDFYLLGFDYTAPGPNFLPQYYIHILDSQEIDNPKENFLEENAAAYSLEKEFFYGSEAVAQVYKLSN